MEQRKFRMPTAYTILFCLILLVALSTWLIPAGSYDYADGIPISGSYHAVAPTPQGIGAALKAAFRGFYDAVDVCVFILMVGGFLGVVMKTGAIDAGVSNVITRLQGRENLLITILMLFFGLGGTTYGMWEETMAFFPLLLPIFLAAGYDAVVGVAVILLGAGAGVIASTVNPFATGIAGFSHVIDSLSAIKYAKVKVVRDEMGLATGFEVEGDFPKYGNDDDRADEIGVWLLRTFLEMIKKRHTYRNSEATTSILTITSNVVYGKYTGALPDGRAAFTPFAPGATPSYGAEQNGLLASLNSVAKLPYHWALDGISNTQTINPEALGHSEGERVENLVQVLDGYFDQGAHHLNVNVFGKEKLLDAMEHPEKEEYANFTIRVSGYAVKFIDLTREQQLDVLARTCHGVL